MNSKILKLYGYKRRKSLKVVRLIENIEICWFSFLFPRLTHLKVKSSHSNTLVKTSLSEQLGQGRKKIFLVPYCTRIAMK